METFFSYLKFTLLVEPVTEISENPFVGKDFITANRKGLSTPVEKCFLLFRASFLIVETSLKLVETSSLLFINGRY